MKREHVYLFHEVDGERKFFCFFIDRAAADAWLKKQEDPNRFEVTDTPPERKPVPEAAPTEVDTADVAGRTDKGLDAALAAVSEAKGD